jgi:hypothetical protein
MLRGLSISRLQGLRLVAEAQRRRYSKPKNFLLNVFDDFFFKFLDVFLWVS